MSILAKDLVSIFILLSKSQEFLSLELLMLPKRGVNILTNNLINFMRGTI